MYFTLQSIIDSKYKILGTTSSYPHKDNCYRVKITDKKTGKSYVSGYFKIVEYNLIMTIKELHKKGIKKEVISELLTQIEEYGDSRYFDGSFDESYDG